LVYNARRLPDGSHLVDMPFLSSQQFPSVLPTNYAKRSSST